MIQIQEYRHLKYMLLSLYRAIFKGMSGWVDEQVDE